MPGYKTHVTVGAACGTALGGMSWFFGGVPAIPSVMAGCLCAIGSVVPDIDSKTSQSFRKCLAMTAGFSSLLLVSRLRDFPLNTESVAMIGGGMFVLIWFFIGGLVRKLTVHRGMCHSLPAAVIAGEVIYLLSSGAVSNRCFNAFAIFLGVLVHLLLDEFYSVQVNRKNIVPGVKIKKSLGSALKLLNFDDPKASIVTFLILCVLVQVIIHESAWTKNLDENGQATELSAKQSSHTYAILEHIKTKYPSQFDLLVIKWAAENQLILRPDRLDNPKWQELERLMSSSESTEIKNAATQNISPF